MCISIQSYDPVMVGQDVVGTYNIGPSDPRTSTEANLDVGRERKRELREREREKEN